MKISVIIKSRENIYICPMMYDESKRDFSYLILDNQQYKIMPDKMMYKNRLSVNEKPCV